MARLDQVLVQVGLARPVVEVNVAVGGVDHNATAGVAVVGRHAGMCPHHVLMGSIDPVVVFGVHIGADVDAAEFASRHLFDQVDDVVHLHLDDIDQAAAVSWLQVGAVQREEVREAWNGRAQV